MAMLQAYLSHPVFSREKGMGILEQLLCLQRLSEEYHAISGEEMAQNTHFCSAKSHATTPEAAYPVDNGLA